MSDANIQIITTTLTVMGGLGVAYITYVVSQRRKSSKPKDRMDTIFDGYEKLITQQQVEIDRKGKVITSLENVVERLEEELTKTRQLLNDARTDLSEAREQNEELKTQLTAMREQYSNENNSRKK